MLLTWLKLQVETNSEAEEQCYFDNSNVSPLCSYLAIVILVVSAFLQGLHVGENRKEYFYKYPTVLFCLNNFFLRVEKEMYIYSFLYKKPILIYLVLGPHLLAFRDYSWFCTKNYSWQHWGQGLMRCQQFNQGWPHARQTPSPLCSCSNPAIYLFKYISVLILIFVTNKLYSTYFFRLKSLLD